VGLFHLADRSSGRAPMPPLFPAAIHHAGSKANYSAFRDKLVQWRFGGDVSLQSAFFSKASVFVDGEPRAFEEVCGERNKRKRKGRTLIDG